MVMVTANQCLSRKNRVAPRLYREGKSGISCQNLNDIIGEMIDEIGFLEPRAEGVSSSNCPFRRWQLPENLGQTILFHDKNINRAFLHDFSNGAQGSHFNK